jgi:hypothetical protein
MIALQLNRAGRPVSSFLSALGSLRETRLTATLGFLASRFPEQVLPLFTKDVRKVTGISVEETDEGDRYDVLLRQDKCPLIVEAKTGTLWDSQQLVRYVRNVRKKYKRQPELVVVDVSSLETGQFIPGFDEIRSCVADLRFQTWTAVASVCRELIRRKKTCNQDPIAAAIAEDLLIHLKENRMITDERPEIYLRDMSTSDSVELYFRYGIYKCQTKFQKSARGNLYFAPYFTKQTAETLSDNNLVPIGEGISYVSKIKEMQIVKTKKVLDYLKTTGVKDPKKAAALVQKKHHNPDVLVLLLGSPRHLFLSPVTKAKLKGFGKGMLGARSCTLDELLVANENPSP